MLFINSLNDFIFSTRSEIIYFNIYIVKEYGDQASSAKILLGAHDAGCLKVRPLTSTLLAGALSAVICVGNHRKCLTDDPNTAQNTEIPSHPTWRLSVSTNEIEAFLLQKFQDQDKNVDGMLLDQVPANCLLRPSQILSL